MHDLDSVLRENIRIMAQVITEVCQRNTRGQLSDPPLSRNQFYLLNILAKSGGFPVGELARILDISNAATSKNIDRLEALGYVGRSVNASDRRSMEVSLTPAGTMFVEEFERITAEKQKPLMAAFTEEEKTLLLGLLRRVIRHTLADEQNCDLICLQCGGRCGSECSVEDLAGICRRSARS